MTRRWLFLLAIAVVLFVAVAWLARPVEGFATADTDTLLAQRQQLQFEGERRYNDFARLQPSSVTVDPGTVVAALQTGVAVPTSKSASLLGILGSSLGLGAADDGSNKQGPGVEQTGVVAQKIAFCESLGTDCSALADPRAAECGICLHGGTDSTGKAHRGGLFISSDDQIRKGVGKQTPTIGTCPAANFVTDPTWCGTRSNELTCELKSVLTDTDECGVCFGGASAGKNGLVYMGPKGRTFDATMAISHPGYHTDGAGNLITVTRPDGTLLANLNVASIGAIPTNAFSPQILHLPGIREGDQLVITIRGPPVVWAGYIANATLSRYFSIDVGVQGMSPAGAFEIAGDAYSSMVTNVMNGIPGWSAYQADLPRTVMWFQRQSNVVPASVVSAKYGSSNNMADATKQIAPVAGTGTGDIVSQGVNYRNIDLSGDPDPTVQKNLFLNQDDGNTLVYHDNTQVDPSKFQNTVTLYFTVPATLADPLGPTDAADCAAGPIITTTAGLSAFGSHSCYNADGSANLSTGCLSELYQSAGGTAAGNLNPAGSAGTAPLLAAVAAANPGATPSTVTIDMITNFLGLQNDIMTYQADQYGNAVDFATYRTATQNLLGRTPGNPCDGPTAATGPHTVECLDYLWRTSGLLGAEPTLPKGDPTLLPYQYCTKAGTAAPYLQDGTPNTAANAIANQQGGMSQVRAYYKSLHDAAANPPAGASPDQINTALQQCMGANYSAPPPKPFDQCAPEVFQVVPSGGYTATPDLAPRVCSALGAQLATLQQLKDAQGLGAEWCSAGWVQDDPNNAYYPMQSLKPGCGNGPGVQQYLGQWLPNQKAGTGGSLGNGNPATALAGVNCYGVKPPQGTPEIQSFNVSTGTWNAPQMPTPGMRISLAPVTNGGQTVRHANFTLYSSPTDAGGLLDLDGTFDVVPANNGIGGFVSFRSINYPDRFLRENPGGSITLDPATSNPDTFKDDSSFSIVAPVASSSPLGFSIQSSRNPSKYKTFSGQVMMTDSPSTNAVWKIIPALDGSKNLSK